MGAGESGGLIALDDAIDVAYESQRTASMSHIRPKNEHKSPRRLQPSTEAQVKCLGMPVIEES